MRTYFVTFTTHTPQTEEALRLLGATAIEPARKLPARYLPLCPCCTGTEGVQLSAWSIYRVDFDDSVDFSRRSLERMPGVLRLRATLQQAPSGEDLPAALRPLPPRRKTAKTPKTSTKGKRPSFSVTAPAIGSLLENLGLEDVPDFEEIERQTFCSSGVVKVSPGKSPGEINTTNA